MTQVSDLPPPTSQGTFAKTPFAQVLVYVLERGLTGTLEVVAPPVDAGASAWATILVIDGQPAKARTSEPVAYLGSVMHALGYIDDAQLNASLRTMSEQGRLHGEILREMGVIDEAELHEGLRVQLVQKLEHLFTWPAETRFAYYDGFDALHTYGADDLVHLDPLPLVWAAIRQEPPWEHVHATLTRVGNGALRLSPHAQLDRFDFQKDERAAADMLRERAMRVHELTACRIVGAATTQLLSYCLLITRQVDLVAPAEAAPSAGSITQSGTGQRVARVQLQQVTKGGGVVEERAAPIRTDGRAASPLPSKPADTTAGGATKSARPSLAPAHEARKREIIQRAVTVTGEDYFQMLGLPRTASAEDVQNAYLQLAKIWHPDRLPAFMSDVKEPCATVFAHLTEAQQTLYDPKRRAQYMTLLDEGGATPDDQAQIHAVLEAATNFQKAEICLRRQDFAQAESLVRGAHLAEPKQPEYLALLAWLESMKPESQGTAATLACVAKLDQALLWNDKCERAYFYRGMLHKRLQNVNVAVRDFRRAAELNPRNIDAIREVRLHEMRKGRGSVPPPRPEADRVPSQRASTRPKRRDSEPSLSKLFGKLFKK
jgi:DnaJ-domain-containing protein 1